jgi:hypothetical protein
MAYSRNEQYQIKGKTSQHLNGEYVMLFTFDNNEVLKVDTAIITGGEFFFKGNRRDKEFSILTTGNYPDTVRSAKLVLEPGVIEVYLDTISFIRGTPLCDIYQEYQNGVLRRQNISLQIEEIEENEYNKELVDSLKNALRLIPGHIQFMKSNISNTLGQETFREDCFGLYYEDFFDIYELADTSFRQDPKILLCHEDMLINKRKKEERRSYQDLHLSILRWPRQRVNRKSFRIMRAEPNMSFSTFGLPGVRHVFVIFNTSKRCIINMMMQN